MAAKKRNSSGPGRDRKTQLTLHAMLFPGTLLIIVFGILPLYGILIAFKAYRPMMGFTGIFTSAWNQFENFKQVFRSPEFWPMIRNTLGINLIGQFISIPMTILFALLLNELKSRRFRSFVQTATYLPHFLSWVIFGGLVINILSPDGGALNRILMSLHLIDEPILFIGDTKYFWGIVIVSGLIKDVGFGAIIYLAAIAGVDPVLYEAATIDGANRLQKIWHVTMPGILPTVMIMFIFAVAGMLNNNFTQIYVLQNPLNQPASQVIDTYVYQIGLQKFQFGVGTATALLKSVLALGLLQAANYVSNKITNTGLF